MTEAILILNQVQIDQKIHRLAYQIYEQHFGEQEIYVCGIQNRGFELAVKIADALQKISGYEVKCSKVLIDKANPMVENIKLEPDLKVKDKIVILCDDVLYTGKTLAYAAIPFLTHQVKQLQCLVLIDRNHIHFPIKPTFVGLTLATTLQENVEVDFTIGSVKLK